MSEIPYKHFTCCNYTFFLQVLLQCYAVIQEIPTLNRFRKNSMTYDSVYHLISVMTYNLTKVSALNITDVHSSILLPSERKESKWYLDRGQKSKKMTGKRFSGHHTTQANNFDLN